MITSKAIRYKDFSSRWYKHWSVLLKQTEGLYGQRIHNKAWQNAVILQTLATKGFLRPGKRAIGFGVGTERIPSALASLGVTVTATDQAVETGQKAGWDNLDQLTHNKYDLNRHGIAKAEAFEQNVEFINCDMNNIGVGFNSLYDIVWSNCALGHLGSLDAGLAFIENSLRCLKPGGIAIHTTEVNIASNTETLDSGGTVIFRQGDMVNLFERLRQQGYACAPLYLNFGSQPEDFTVSGFPYDNDPLLKLNVGRHLLSQMVLVITKPKRPHRHILIAHFMKQLEIRLNSHLAASYLRKNTALQTYLHDNALSTTNGPVVPYKRRVKIAAATGKRSSRVTLRFKNSSPIHLYDTFQVLHSGHPLVVSTANPINRLSKLASGNWPSKNRPALQLSPSRDLNLLDGIPPGADFTAHIELKTPRKPGVYEEAFCLLLENGSAVPDSDFSIEVTVK